MYYSWEMRGAMMQRLLLASLAVVALSACRSRESKPVAGEPAVEADVSAGNRRAEKRAAEPDDESVCERAVVVYDGSIEVNASDYIHSVARGDDYVDERIEGLDRIVSKSARVRFTLDYPFEKPFSGVVTGEITLRRTIDAIRAGFRTMYEGTTQRDIPGLENKAVTGPYGEAFHVIDDLVIEGIELCGDDVLSISIGS